MAQSDADKIVRAINALTAELKHHRPKRGRVQVLSEPYPTGTDYFEAVNAGRVTNLMEPYVSGPGFFDSVAGEPSLEDPDDSGYDCD